MKVRISKAPDGKGKFINKLGGFMQKAKMGAQVTNRTEIRKEILSRADFGDAPETIANDLANIYGVDYFDMVDEVADLIGSPGAADPETVTKETIPEEDVVEPGTEFDYSNNGIAEDIEAEQAELDDDEDTEEYKKKGGSISKNKFVKGVMRSLKKAAEGVQQETSNVANITDIPIGGRQSFVNNWKQGVKNLGNEHYAKKIHDLANAVQPTNVPINEGLETAGKGREVRKADRQARRATKDFRNAFGDMAAGYFGAPGVPNYLQMINVVDPSKMPQGQMPSGTTMPGIDFQYKKGPWWSGQREWSAKGVPAGMMPGFGNMQGNMPGYNQGSWGNSWNTGWQRTTVPGTIRREKVIKAINNQADPTKVNNVALNTNTNGTTTTNTEWQNSGRQAEKASLDAANMAYNDYYFDEFMVPSGMPDFEFTPRIREDRKWSSPINQVDFINTEDKQYNKKGEFDLDLFGKLSQEDSDILDYGKSYLQKDSKGNEYSVRAGYGTPEYEAENERLKLDKETKQGLFDLNQRFQPPGYEDGGFVDPSQMQPGVLQKFMGGGDDFISPMVQYQNNDLATKNVNDPYYRQGGLIKADAGLQFMSAAEEAFGSNPAANREAYNKAVASGKTNDTTYNTATNYGALIGANTSNTNTNTNTTNTNTYNNQGYNQSYNTGYSNNYIQPITAPGVGQQILNMFNPFKKNKNFTWASQSGPMMGLNGQPFNPATMGANNLSGYVQDWEGTKNPWYRGGKETLKVTNRYVGANGQPVTTTNKPGTGAGVGVYAPGQGVNANMKPGANNAPGASTAPGKSTVPKAEGNDGSFRDRRLDRRVERWDRRANAGMYGEDYVDTPGSSTEPIPESSYRPAPLQPGAFPPGDPRGDYMRSQLTVPNKPVEEQPMPEGYPSNNVGPINNFVNNSSQPSSQEYLAKDYGDIGSELGPGFEEFMATNPSPFLIDDEIANRLGERNKEIDRRQENYIPQEQRDLNQQSLKNRNVGLAYGGYVPNFGPGGGFTGLGPFDPNNNLNSQDCNEFEKKDPNSPCYVPAFARPGATIQEMMGTTSNTNQPQDFEVNYDLHKAKTIDTNAAANIGAATSAGLQWNKNRKDSNYASEWEFNNLTADNRDPGASDVDNTGGYSGLSGRNMVVSSNPYIVGQAGFGAKYGGTPNYEEGGTYNMTKKELMQFMAQGGQIEFI